MHQLQALQRAMALVHADQQPAGQQEGEQQRQAVAVVQAGEQHHEQQQRECEPARVGRM